MAFDRSLGLLDGKMQTSDAGKMQPKQQDQRHQHHGKVFEHGVARGDIFLPAPSPSKVNTSSSHE